MAHGGKLTAFATVLFLVVFHATSSADDNMDLMAACRQLCSDEDRDGVDAASIDQCVLGCRRMTLVALENRLLAQQEPVKNDEENYIRTNRIWFFPDTSKWQTKTLTSGIGSRSRSAGAYLRIGRSLADMSALQEYSAGRHDAADRRAGRRQHSAGRYLRIGRAGESADREMMASGRPGEDQSNLRMVNRPGEDQSNLLKVNRDVTVDNDALQQP